MPSWEEPYITFHIVWHPGCTQSQDAASHLIQHFTRDRFAIEEMGVSVFEWSKPPLGSAVPPPFDLAAGETAVIVVLVSDEIEQDTDWSNYVGRLADRCTSGDDGAPITRLFLVAMTHGRLATSFCVQALCWRNWPGDYSRRARRLVREVTYETSRMLRDTLDDESDLARQMERVCVFLSHSKHDDIGERVAKCIRNWLQEDVNLSVFLDIVDVPAGLPSDEALEAGVQQSAVLIVHSDSFSSRGKFSLRRRVSVQLSSLTASKTFSLRRRVSVQLSSLTASKTSTSEPSRTSGMCLSFVSVLSSPMASSVLSAASWTKCSRISCGSAAPSAFATPTPTSCSSLARRSY